MISDEQVVIFGSFIYLIGICRCFKINPGFLLYLLFKVSLSNLSPNSSYFLRTVPFSIMLIYV